MINRINTLKLGVFFIAGITLLMVGLFLIGAGKGFLKDTFKTYAVFRNTSGLMPGNYVKLSGINIGTVKSIRLHTDSTAIIEMEINEDSRAYIKKDALVTIGTEGLLGDRYIAISPGKNASRAVEEGDMIETRPMVETEEMVRTLSNSNENLALITWQVRLIAEKLNSNNTLWQVLNDTSIALHIRSTIANINASSARSVELLTHVTALVAKAEGPGTISTILNDTLFSGHLKNSAFQLDKATGDLSRLSATLKEMAKEIQSSNGLLGTLVHDDSVAARFRSTMYNLEKGTANFNENMEALQHSFLLKGYFKRKDKKHQP